MQTLWPTYTPFLFNSDKCCDLYTLWYKYILKQLQMNLVLKVGYASAFMKFNLIYIA
jgi:hypothetical protein